MESKIRRKSKVFDFTIQSATASCVTIPMFDMAGGLVSVGTMNTAATQINLWVSDAEAGPFRQLYDKDGAAVKITLDTSAAKSSEGRVYAMPDEAFPAQYVKFAGATTASTGTVGKIMFKG